MGVDDIILMRFLPKKYRKNIEYNTYKDLFLFKSAGEN